MLALFFAIIFSPGTFVCVRLNDAMFYFLFFFILDRENALLYGREAKKFSMIGLGCGIAIIVIILAIYGVAIALALSQANQMH